MLKKAVLLAFISSFLIACASSPQMPVQFKPTLISEGSSVAVIIDDLPQPAMVYPGAGCLLCLGAAAVANSDVSTFAKTLPTDDLESLKSEVVANLKSINMNAFLVEEKIDLSKLPKNKKKPKDIPNISKKDFGELAKKLKADKILIIDINGLGIQRNYSGYIPTSDPMAYVIGTGYLVDPKTNTFQWYLPINETRLAENNNWKEKPEYPGLTNAYFQAVEKVRDNILAPFSKK